MISVKMCRCFLFLIGLAAANALAASPGAAEEPNEARQAELQTLIDTECRACHSEAGDAKPISSGGIGYSSDDYLSEAILEGIQKKGMPAWGDRLSLDEALWIVGRLRKDALN